MPIYVDSAYCTLGLSDIVLFAIFENGHYAADHTYILMSSIPKIDEFGWASGKVFTFKNITGTLKNLMYIFFWKCANAILYFIEQSSKIKFKKKKKFMGPPIWANWLFFYQVKGKQLFLLLINIKMTSPSGTGFKNVCENFCCCPF